MKMPLHPFLCKGDPLLQTKKQKQKRRRRRRRRRKKQRKKRQYSLHTCMEEVIYLFIYLFIYLLLLFVRLLRSCSKILGSANVGFCDQTDHLSLLVLLHSESARGDLLRYVK